ncbi:MAG: SPASM domain-containing protein [Oscillospiraceae bacterium]|nr:SPASM domain-containing protein [Oscillospiraceae bacterium]
MRCKYCFYTDEMHCRTDALRGIMPLRIVEKIIRDAALSADGYINFIFQGGEPTLAGINFFKETVRLQKELIPPHIKVFNSIQTNGLLIDEEWAEFLSENNFLAGVSLDGTAHIHDAFRLDANGHGTFSQAMAAAQLLKRFGVETNILCVITEQAAQCGAELYRSLTDAGFEWLQFIPCISPFEGTHHSFELTPQRYLDFLLSVFACYEKDRLSGKHVSVRFFDDILRRLSGSPVATCGMNGRCAVSYTFEADGSVYPCDFYAVDEYLLGNILHSSLDRLARSAAAEKFLCESLPLPHECRSCEFFSLCRGGCRRDRDNAHQLGKNRWCSVYRQFFSAILS